MIQFHYHVIVGYRGMFHACCMPHRIVLKKRWPWGATETVCACRKGCAKDVCEHCQDCADPPFFGSSAAIGKSEIACSELFTVNLLSSGWWYFSAHPAPSAPACNKQRTAEASVYANAAPAVPPAQPQQMTAQPQHQAGSLAWKGVGGFIWLDCLERSFQHVFFVEGYWMILAWLLSLDCLCIATRDL